MLDPYNPLHGRVVGVRLAVLGFSLTIAGMLLRSLLAGSSLWRLGWEMVRLGAGFLHFGCR